jgi:hypothetical protein
MVDAANMAVNVAEAMAIARLPREQSLSPRTVGHPRQRAIPSQAAAAKWTTSGCKKPLTRRDPLLPV